jgi:hypothetical protein
MMNNDVCKALLFKAIHNACHGQTPKKDRGKYFGYICLRWWLPIIVTFQNFSFLFLPFWRLQTKLKLIIWDTHTHIHRMIYYFGELAPNDSKNFTLTCNLSPPPRRHKLILPTPMKAIIYFPWQRFLHEWSVNLLMYVCAFSTNQMDEHERY